MSLRIIEIVGVLTLVVSLLGGFRWVVNEWRAWKQKRLRGRLLLLVSLPAFALFLLLGAAQADPDGYRNCATTEAAYDAASTTLMCEDFEVNGVAQVNGHGKWYAEDCDTANGNGGITVRTKGWCGTIFANPITPDGAEICGGAGVNGTTCAGNHGTKVSGEGGVNMADHNAEKRKQAAGVRRLFPRVTPDSTKDDEWRGQAARNYILGAGGEAPPTSGSLDYTRRGIRTHDAIAKKKAICKKNG